MVPLYKKLFFPFIKYLGRKKIERNFIKDPIILGGCGRSGTTLLLSILDAHPDIYSLKKENGAFLIWNDKDTEPRPVRIDRLHRSILFKDIPSEADRYCLKNPGNVRHFGKILKYYDNQIKLIHIVRDARDVLTSVHPKDFGKYWVPIKRWINDVKAGLKYEDHPRVFTIKYENLINNYEDRIQKLLGFLKEPFTEEMYNWSEHTELIESKAWQDRVQKLHADSIRRWKQSKYEKRVKKIMSNPKVTELLEYLDYI